VPEIPNRTFPGKVTRIADALQPGSRTLLTEVDIPNPDATLTSGIYCTASPPSTATQGGVDSIPLDSPQPGFNDGSFLRAAARQRRVSSK
jgi:hypothetical protein